MRARQDCPAKLSGETFAVIPATASSSTAWRFFPVNQTVLTRIAATALFKPPTQVAGGAFLFMRLNPTGVPQQLPLDDTWATTGTPTALGYYLFLKTVPTDSDAANFESQLRSLLTGDAPTASSFVWLKYNPKGTPGANVKIQFTVPLSLDVEKRPRVAANVVVPLPQGMPAIAFGDGTLVLPSLDGDGFLRALVCTYPSLPGAQNPAGSGITIPLVDAGIGCLRFDGLISLPGKDGGSANGATKALVNVQRDPLDPFDFSRNFTTLTGLNYFLSHDQNGYHISLAP
jgi:hypothetical protein